jgi:hypothetical protein
MLTLIEVDLHWVQVGVTTSLNARRAALAAGRRPRRTAERLVERAGPGPGLAVEHYFSALGHVEPVPGCPLCEMEREQPGLKTRAYEADVRPMVSGNLLRYVGGEWRVKSAPHPRRPAEVRHIESGTDAGRQAAARWAWENPIRVRPRNGQTKSKQGE